MDSPQQRPRITQIMVYRIVYYKRKNCRLAGNVGKITIDSGDEEFKIIVVEKASTWESVITVSINHHS